MKEEEKAYYLPKHISYLEYRYRLGIIISLCLTLDEKRYMLQKYHDVPPMPDVERLYEITELTESHE